jgi:ATP-binding cassette, subfamily C (CFTR/MRP), member 1
MLSGDVRRNLDPAGQYSDTELRGVLQEVELHHVQLDDLVKSGGANWSGGSRQLLVLARVLLSRRNTKLLALDEASARWVVVPEE